MVIFVQLKLYDIMKSRKMTDDAVASRLGCAASTVVHWRLGVYEPRASNLVKLCEMLDCSADDMLAIQRKRDIRLPRSQSINLLKAVTMAGQYTSERYHQMATAAKQARGGKVTEFERLLRGIAEALYCIEIAQKQMPRPVVVEAVQLRLF